MFEFIDHTLLDPKATWEEIRQLCEEAITYSVASVCIPPCFVKQAKAHLQGQVAICTVVGFPNGYQTKKVKIYETQDAIAHGADEIDMVIHLGDVKEAQYMKILDEIKAIKAVCGNRILKVIIETCVLTDEEKIELCKVVSKSGAEFIKTSTGFSNGGATLEDIALFKQHIDGHVQMKAAGGIASVEQAQLFLRAGVTRLGSSSLVKMLNRRDKQ